VVELDPELPVEPVAFTVDVAAPAELVDAAAAVLFDLAVLVAVGFPAEELPDGVVGEVLPTELAPLAVEAREVVDPGVDDPVL
jgi:hypothetical protein